MIQRVKQDILDVLSKVVDAIKNHRIYELRELSNHVIHNASIFQDKDSIRIAVIIYALSKILKERNDFEQIALNKMEDAGRLLEKDDFNNYDICIKSLLSEISNQSTKTRFYIEEVLKRAEISKASKMYEHGISLAQVADALDVSRWELMDYIGKTTIADSFEDISDIDDRLSFARSIFTKE
ncbi:hypothetical protein JW930_05865 [Candidatus Woesearchaeota archaeon]|nr:hypothetical protein [Candidatus Woesearchaeota archaeon]